MRKQVLSLILAALLILSFVGCSTNQQTSSSTNSSQVKEKDAETESDEITLNILWQQEVTETFMQLPIEKMKESFPNVKINLSISPQAYSEINNLIASGNAPDIFFTWLSEVNYYDMIKENLLNPVNEILELQTVEEDTILADKLLRIGLSQGEYEGSHYMLPITQYNAMNFYNSAFFEKSGIQPQLGNIDEFNKTCDAIAKNTQAVPMNYAGTYAFMVMDAFIFPMINNIDPVALAAINNGEPDAWIADSVVESVEVWEDMVKNGYVTPDSLALDHIQSQIEFINNRAAMVPVGTWLEGEMADQWPQDFQLTPFLAPGKEAKGNSVVPIVEYMVLPKQSDNSKLPYIGELVRQFYSEENALKCLEETGSLMAYQKIGDNLMQLLPQSVQQGFALTQDAEKILPMYKLTNKNQFLESSNLINAISSGEITAKEFCEKMNEFSK